MKRFLCAVLLAAAVAARADVTVKRVTTTDGFGGGFTSDATERLKGTDRRSDASIKFQNMIMNKMAGGSRTEITLVGEDRMLHLDNARKTYRESSISGMKDMMEKAGARAKAPGKEGRAPTHRVTKSQIKVEPTGEKKTVNGYPCERVRMTMLMEIENLETREKTETRLVSDNWNTPETGDLKAVREAETAFGRAFAAKMGLELSPEESGRWGLGMAAMFGVPEDQMKSKLADFKKELSKSKGMPVVTEVSWYGKSSGGAAAPAQKPHPKKEDDEMPGLSGGAGGIASGFAGMMMKKKMEAAADRSAARSQARASGEEPLFKSRTELKEILPGPVDAGLFQVPAGYKKLEK